MQLVNAYRRNIVLQNEQVRQNRYIFNIIINCVCFFGAFELDLRGRNENLDSTNPGIFIGLISFRAELRTVLKAYLQKASVLKEPLKLFKLNFWK